ncbi:MAG: bestrophin family protein [Planctomycetota bacterium]|jgi:putative membrane protein
MIVRKHLRWHRILVRCKGFLSYIAILAAIVLWLHELDPATEPGLTLKPLLVHIPLPLVAMLATTIALFLAFRNNSAYDRWWEARKIWGGIVNISRTIGRQTTSFTNLSERPADDVAEFQREFVYRHLAWINALRIQLRDHSNWDDIRPFVSDSEFEWLTKRKNKATQLVQKQGQRLTEATQNGLLTESRYHELLDKSLTELYDLQGKCERIKNTPLPRQYDYFPRVFLFLFVTLLPSGMVTELEKVDCTWLVIPLATCVSFMFYVLMRVGEFNEDPFDGRITDTPMSSLCRTIEIDLREQLGETDLPPKLEPSDGILM